MTTTVTLGFIDDGTVTHQFLMWALEFWTYDLGHRRYVNARAGGGIAAESPCRYRIADGRNDVVRQFLTRDAEWLWMVDTDLSMPMDSLYRLVDAADPVERPIIGGTYLYPCIGHGAVIPSFGFSFDGTAQSATQAIEAAVTGTVMECGHIAGGCLLVHRDVFVALEKTHPGPWTWFAHDPNPNLDDNILAEDTSFCLRARAAGFPIHVHTGVRGVHHGKPVDLTWEPFLAAQARAGR